MQTNILPVKMEEKYKLQLRVPTDNMTMARIMISHAGKVRAVISKYDYMHYKKVYWLDQLSRLLGELFIRVFEYYSNGEEIRIPHELKKVNTGPFL